jgi:hypothetical protein
MLNSNTSSSVLILRLSRIHWSICSLTSIHVTVYGAQCQQHLSVILWIFLQTLELPCGSHSYHYAKLSFFRNFHQSPFPLTTKIGLHRSSFFFDAFYQWSSHVKHVTEFSPLQIHWKPTTCEWEKVYIICKKVKLSLFLAKHVAMKTYERVEVLLHAFFISALDGGERSALRSGRFTHGERVPGTHWIGAWVGFRAGLDTVARRKKSLPLLSGI